MTLPPRATLAPRLQALVLLRRGPRAKLAPRRRTLVRSELHSTGSLRADLELTVPWRAHALAAECQYDGDDPGVGD
jgi:hypothetical protein